METLLKTNNYNGVLQTALNSGFNAKSPAQEVIKGRDLSGRVAIVTGGNTGIGLETVKVLTSAGATVIVAARDLDKAKANLQGMPKVEVEALDLINPKSIDAFTERFLSTGRPLHLLINNAGIMWVPLRRDCRGFESQLAVNFLGQYHLTARLWPALKQAYGARVVNVSSQGHQFGAFDFDDPDFLHKPYDTLQAYGQSKTALNLFTVELDNRAKEFGVRAYALHPGSVGGTELGREAPIELFQQMGFCDEQGNIFPEVLASLKTVSQGAASTIWCATSPMLNDLGGVYCEDVDVAELADDVALPGKGVRSYSLDQSNAKRLWRWTQEATGVKFEI